MRNARPLPIVVVALALAAAAPWRSGCSAQVEPRPCVDWVVALAEGGSRRHLCDVAALAPILRRCPPEGPVRVGDELLVVPHGAACATRVRPVPAASRLRMGLRLDPSAEDAAGLEAIPGVGPALARAIVAGRPYERLVDLERVRGIGTARRRMLARYLTTAPRRLLWPPSPPPAAPAP